MDQINHSFIARLHLHCPHDCNARCRTNAIYDFSPPPLLHTLHYTILAMAILCKGQAATRVRAPLPNPINSLCVGLVVLFCFQAVPDENLGLSVRVKG